MDTQAQITLRTKKLGVLIRDARLAARKTMDECASAIGVTRGILRSYEEGRRAPSLPQMETLVFYLNLPIDHFWGQEALSDDTSPTELLWSDELGGVRQRMIGAQLRQQRLNASISVKDLAGQAGMPASRIKAYELGQRPIPLPELEALLGLLDGRIEDFFDTSGPIGQWMSRQRAIEQFLHLPDDLQAFVSQPVNRPYLELALKLSEMSTSKLRSVAEDLLDITL